MIDAFSYLSVLLSIILGLAITQVLQGYRALILARRRVRLSAPPLIWSALLMLFVTQAWWASFGLRSHQTWSFVAFSVVLLQMVLLYMMAAVVLPDAPGEGDIDLAAHHEAHRRYFFGFLIAVLLTSIAKDWVLDGQGPQAENMAFHAVLIATSIAGIVLPGGRAQLALALLAAAGFILYVAELFASLGAD